MDEFKFVIRCFVFAGLLMMFSQMKTEGITYEAKVESFLTRSEVAHFMQDAAAGGVKAIEKALLFSKAFVSEKMNQEQKPEKNYQQENAY